MPKRIERRFFYSLGSIFLFLLVAAGQVQAGIVLVSSRGDDRVAAFSESGQFLYDFIPAGSGGLNGPVGLRIHPTTGELLVASNQSNQVLRYNAATGQFLGEFASGASLNGPSDLAFDASNNLYVANFGTTPLGGGSTVARFTSAGASLPDFATGLSNPTGIVFGPGGDAFVTNFDFGFVNNSIFRYDSGGTQTATLTNAGLFGPAGLTLHDNQLYVASLIGSLIGAPNVLRFNLDNTFDTTVAFGGDLNFPAGLLFLPNGDLLVSNAGDGSLARFTPDGLGGFIPAGYFNSDGLGGFTGALVEPSQMLWIAENATATPEPSTLALLGLAGALGGVWLRRRRGKGC